MSKNIVFCADGTNNHPDQCEDEDRLPDPTNVYKLFERLDGALSGESSQNEREKRLTLGQNCLQVAKYVHGVGDSSNPILKIMGCAFGSGVISRIVRGYTFISRHYEPGDRIFIVGFSRGAYTARALGGLIASQGLLRRSLTTDKEAAYRFGAQAWYRHRHATAKRESYLARLSEAISDLPAFLAHDDLKDSDFVPIDKIASVAVWDTVGSLGIPDFKQGKRMDAFRFADTRLSPKVEMGLQALSLDERREDFQPTFWDQAPNVCQLVFPGAHCDVGGGYPVARGESGLSDIALNWMLERLRSAGVMFSTKAQPLSPDVRGTAHKPWAHGVWIVPGVRLGARAFPANMPCDPSVQGRMSAGPVIAEPGEAPAPYQPKNLPRGGGKT